MGYDVIGDIHGHAAKLQALLRKMGYAEQDSDWTPPAGRKAIFLGDLIDRGPEQAKVVDIVRRMVDRGHAYCIMGNHEFNAIGYATAHPDRPGRFLRGHTPAKLREHVEFLKQVGEGSPLHLDMVEWFRSLPPFLDLDGIRCVHAWWHQPHVDLVAARWTPGSRMSDEFLVAAFDRDAPECAAMEGLSKGQEIRLPEGHHFLDHSGVKRQDVRTRWWMEAGSYRELAIVPDGQEHCLPDLPVPTEYAGGDPEGTPVFIGHYWFKGEPVLQSRKVACLDWAAAGDGPLVSYRWDGESELDPRHFVAAG